MWPLKKRISLKESGIFEDFTDCHSHILPGVDDGVQTLEEGVEGRFAEPQAAYSGPIKLHLASENMLDNLFEERLEKNDLLPLGKNSDHLLVETSYFNPPMGLNNILLRIKAKGYYPLLAHPERYIYMGESDYQRLKDMGVKFQLNLPSLVGIYGKSVQKKAKQLLKHTMYDMVGSDLHTLTQCSLFNEHCMSSLVTVRLK